MKKWIFVFAFLILLVVLYFVSVLTGFNPVPSPAIFEPEYKEITVYGDANYVYQCSKPIKGRLQQERGFDGKYHNTYKPVDLAEAKLFCHSTAAIEYEGKLTVLQKPEVLEMIKKYDYKDVSIKALEFEYIEDKGFVHRLLPDFKDEEIGCIIIVETPNEKKVYLENEELETFKEIDYRTFESYLNKVSPADKKLFLENLQ